MVCKNVSKYKASDLKLWSSGKCIADRVAEMLMMNEKDDIVKEK